MISKRSIKWGPAVTAVALVALAFAAVGVASASAATQHWYAGGAQLTAGEQTSQVIENEGRIVMTWNLYGTSVKASCTGAHGEGSVENPVGGGAGAGNTSLTLSGCTTNVSCTISSFGQPNGTVVITPVVEAATELEGKSAVRFEPTSGFQFSLGGTSCVLPGSYEATGSFTGVSTSDGRLTFTAAGSSLKIGGSSVSFTGVMREHTGGGLALFVAP